MQEINTTSAHLLPGSLSLTQHELTRISNLIYRRAGIVVNNKKSEMIFNRLSRRIQALALRSFGDYASILESQPEHPEWQNFINAMTTNLTSFFRESHHFPTLAEHARQRSKDYRVWCAAASTGEEPCSIAMTLDEALGKSTSGPRIWATDIDTNVLAKAQAGIYRAKDIQVLTLKQKRDYFLRGTAQHHECVRVKSELLDSIHYQQLNLLSDNWPILHPFDAIFCRNVMIYFDSASQFTLLTRFARLLKPGGLLFIGHSEHVTAAELPLRLRGRSVYELMEV